MRMIRTELKRVWVPGRYSSPVFFLHLLRVRVWNHAPGAPLDPEGNRGTEAEGRARDGRPDEGGGGAGQEGPKLE
jgi:hypothetical protein